MHYFKLDFLKSHVVMAGFALTMLLIVVSIGTVIYSKNGSITFVDSTHATQSEKNTEISIAQAHSVPSDQMLVQNGDEELTNIIEAAAIGSVLGTRTNGGIKPRNSQVSLRAAAALPVCAVGLTVTQTKKATTADYQYVINNSGTGACTSASLTIYYGDGESFSSSTPKATAAGYYWQLGNLASAQSVTILVTTKVSASTAYNTLTCATANNGQDACVTNAGSDGATTGTAPQPPVDNPPAPQPPVSDPVPPAPQPPVSGFRPKGEYGMWVWVSPLQMSDDYRTNLVNTAAANNISVLYVTMDDYLTIKSSQIAEYNQDVARLVELAAQKNIAIDLEAGWKDWTDPAKRNNSYSIIQYVADYNATHATKVRKVQFDVEPYLLSTYEKNKASVLTTYVGYVDAVVKRAKSSNVSISFVIPHFYDSAQKWTPTVTYGGKTDFTFNHILSMLDTTTDGTIIVMSYRNFAAGNDSIEQISQQEIKDATNHPTKIVIAQETGDVDPSYVTYFGTSRSYMFDQMGKVNTYFTNSNGYGGMAVHYFEPFVQLPSN